MLSEIKTALRDPYQRPEDGSFSAKRPRHDFSGHMLLTRQETSLDETNIVPVASKHLRPVSRLLLEVYERTRFCQGNQAGVTFPLSSFNRPLTRLSGDILPAFPLAAESQVMTNQRIPLHSNK